MQEFIFFVSPIKRLRAGGYTFTVASLKMKVHGPFGTRGEAMRFRDALEQKWRARAQALGGSFRLEAPNEWIVAVPPGTRVVGLEWKSGPVERKGRDPRDDPPLLRGGPWKIR